jgi:hypothetical protein
MTLGRFALMSSEVPFGATMYSNNMTSVLIVKIKAIDRQTDKHDRAHKMFFTHARERKAPKNQSKMRHFLMNIFHHSVSKRIYYIMMLSDDFQMLLN